MYVPEYEYILGVLKLINLTLVSQYVFFNHQIQVDVHQEKIYV